MAFYGAPVMHPLGAPGPGLTEHLASLIHSLLSGGGGHPISGPTIRGFGPGGPVSGEPIHSGGSMASFLHGESMGPRHEVMAPAPGFHDPIHGGGGLGTYGEATPSGAFRDPIHSNVLALLLHHIANLGASQGFQGLHSQPMQPLGGQAPGTSVHPASMI